MDTKEWFIDRNKLPQSLDRDELYKLIQEVKEGSKEAREKLIIHNIRLVLYEVTTKFLKVNYDKKDLVSVGNIGLVKAIDTYEMSKGVEFSSYASRCIDNEILMFLRRLKKDENVDSIDRVISRDKDGNELKLEDRLIDDTDLVEDYENSETHKIIRELIKKLPDRDQIIVKLFFGFYSNKTYTKQEIANKLHISRSLVFKIITRSVKELSNQLEAVGVIELHTRAKAEVKSKNIKRKIQSIYEFFRNYKREQVDEMLSKLSETEMALITLRYGIDLDNPVAGQLTQQQSNYFYSKLVPKMKKLLANSNGERKKSGRKPKENNLKQSVIEPSMAENQGPQNESASIEKPIVDVESELLQNLVEDSEALVKADEVSNDITNEDCNKMLELLKTPAFMQMTSVLTTKEIVIISFKLGYVDGKCFSTKSIAKFLKIEEGEVIETARKVLLLYKENINGLRDIIIKAGTDAIGEDIVLSRKLVEE